MVAEKLPKSKQKEIYEAEMEIEPIEHEKWYKVYGKIEVLTPILAPYNADGFSFRIFSKLDGSSKTIINNYDDLRNNEKDELKKKLAKSGYFKINYIFPRITPTEISWLSYFMRPLYYLFKKKHNIVFRLTKITEENVNVRVLGFYIGKKKTGIFLEAVMEGSIFKIEGEANTKIDKIELEAQIGKWKKLGFGRVKITLYGESYRENK